MKKWISLSFLLLSFYYISAQKENNIWYFGEGLGINFNTKPPVILNNGALKAGEGCASICDVNGNLLFYTDGITVFNKQHQVMTNGTNLAGHISSTQNAIIIPWPGKNELYYIFTADAIDNNGIKGYNYSVVDLNKNNGDGEIIIKNQLLYTPSTEKLTMARHCNGIDWWVITSPLNKNEFYCYLVDQDGIHTEPIISSTEPPTPGLFLHGVGSLKVSPNGRKLAMASTAGSYVQVYDFNNATGTVSNEVTLLRLSTYGLEFSPDSKLLYIGSLGNVNKIEQFDLTSYTDAATLEASRITITPAIYNKLPLGMQLGPDNKIYINAPESANLSLYHADAITLPNVKGQGCSFQEDAFKLTAGQKAGIMFPQILYSSLLTTLFPIDIKTTIIDPCKRVVQLEAISGQLTNAKYTWELANGSVSTAERLQTTYSFSKDTFDIQLQVTGDALVCSQHQSITQTINKQIVFQALPKANAGNDTAVVAGQPLQLNGSGGLQYQWTPATLFNNAAIPNPIVTLQTDQNFTLTVTNADGCTDKDSIKIKIYKEATIYVPTAFTPNGDNKNDVLKCFPIGLKLTNFNIYNRWGNTVFSSANDCTGWNGLYQGKMQPQGIYIWIAKGLNYKNEEVIYKGTVALIK